MMTTKQTADDYQIKQQYTQQGLHDKECDIDFLHDTSPTPQPLTQSKKGSHQIEGYFDYVVPPLEGFWWQNGVEGIDYARKTDFNWISVIRLPDFATKEDFDWAIAEATVKKKEDFSKVEFFSYDEGLCVQCMHVGAYDDEPATVELMHKFAEEQGYVLDITEKRLHHEIYLSDARKVVPEKLKTVIRHPIRKEN